MMLRRIERGRRTFIRNERILYQEYQNHQWVQSWSIGDSYSSITHAFPTEFFFANFWRGYNSGITRLWVICVKTELTVTKFDHVPCIMEPWWIDVKCSSWYTVELLIMHKAGGPPNPMHYEQYALWDYSHGVTCVTFVTVSFICVGISGCRLWELE